MRTEHTTHPLTEDGTRCGLRVIALEDCLFTDDDKHEPVHIYGSGEHYDCVDCIKLNSK